MIRALLSEGAGFSALVRRICETKHGRREGRLSLTDQHSYFLEGLEGGGERAGGVRLRV